MAKVVEVGAVIRGFTVRELRALPNGWIIIKTEGAKRPGDFRVRVVTQTDPRVKWVTPKHAHFVIDFYGKRCADPVRAERLFRALVAVWHGRPSSEEADQLRPSLGDLPGYSVDYVLAALEWILDQEDINFTGRPEAKQRELDITLERADVKPNLSRLGSELAVSLFCNVQLGMHPVEAFLRAQLDVNPVKLTRGRV